MATVERNMWLPVIFTGATMPLQHSMHLSLTTQVSNGSFKNANSRSSTNTYNSLSNSLHINPPPPRTIIIHHHTMTPSWQHIIILTISLYPYYIIHTPPHHTLCLQPSQHIAHYRERYMCIMIVVLLCDVRVYRHRHITQQDSWAGVVIVHLTHTQSINHTHNNNNNNNNNNNILITHTQHTHRHDSQTHTKHWDTNLASILSTSGPRKTLIHTVKKPWSRSLVNTFSTCRYKKRRNNNKQSHDCVSYM